MVVNRGDKPLVSSVPAIWRSSICDDWRLLHQKTQGQIYLLHMPCHQGSATFVRRHMYLDALHAERMLDPAIMAYIKRHKLYQVTISDAGQS